jgi:hypothetical protein
MNTRQLQNWRYCLMFGNISKAQNQLQLDSCRRMIEAWFLDTMDFKKANELYNRIQVREVELINIQEQLILENKSI